MDLTTPRPEVISEVTPGVLRVLAPNPSPMTWWGTNSFILGTGSERVLIDPGPDDERHLDALLCALPKGGRISHILVTHAHLDHSGGTQALKTATGAPVYAYGDASAGRSALMDRLARDEEMGGGEGVDTSFRPDVLVRDSQTISTPAGPITALHTPGHMSNHLCFGWNGLTFTGDLIMGWSSSLISPPDGDAAAFRASCKKLLSRPNGPLLSAHGDPITDGHRRIEDLLAHRAMREAKIMNELSAEPKTLEDITRAVYTDIDPRALSAASRNTLAHLIDLTEQNKVIATPKISTKAGFHRA